MILRALIGAAIALIVGRRLIRRRAIREITANPVPVEAARGLVEAALAGGRAHRRQLALNLEPARATAVELLVDGPAFFPRLMADIEAATTDVHILIFGFKDGEIGGRVRDLLVRKVAEGVPVRLLVEAGYSQPDFGSKAFYRTLTEGGVVVTANQGAFLDLDGPFGERRIDWRFDDLGHFDHRKIVVIDGRVAFVGGPGIEDHYANDEFHDL
ncbi:MAG TPA: phospholipase D-like domain-containing protein, partial [Candidatus Limnocylindrales bacterium]|nr:phospholipase D-like domain-containing protein [Candidatus Limnocylindrales bacterium]